MASLRGALLSLGGGGGVWSTLGIFTAPAPGSTGLLPNLTRISTYGGFRLGSKGSLVSSPKPLSLYYHSSSSSLYRMPRSHQSHARSLHTTTAYLLTLTRPWNPDDRFQRCIKSPRSDKLLAKSHLTTSTQANGPTEESSSEGGSGKLKSLNVEGVEVVYFRGLPQLTIPLPSRRERCRFIVKPLTNTVGDLLHMIRHEDKGVDRVAFHSTDGIRIASANTIEMLMERDFEILINDDTYRVVTPPQEKPSEEDLERLSSVRNLVGQLYGALNIDEHQLRKEREMLTELERLRNEVHPMEDKREQINELAVTRTNYMTWIGLGLMSVQFGVLARLTWWEYSWDIMEPVTYFVTYGTAMLAYAYFVLTKQEYVLPQVADRQYLISFHKNAKKVGLDVDKYNRIKDQIHKIETDLRRLRDPLALHLPLKTRLVTQQELDEMISLDDSTQSIVAKASHRIQQMFKKSS